MNDRPVPTCTCTEQVYIQNTCIHVHLYTCTCNLPAKGQDTDSPTDTCTVIALNLITGKQIFCQLLESALSRRIKEMNYSKFQTISGWQCTLH